MKIERSSRKRAHLRRLGRLMLEKSEDQISIERKLDKVSTASTRLVFQPIATPEDKVLANDFSAINSIEYTSNQIVGGNLGLNCINDISNNNNYNCSPQFPMYNSTMLHRNTNKRYSSASSHPSRCRRAFVKSSSWNSSKFLQISLVAALVLSTCNLAIQTQALSSVNSDNEPAKSSSTSSASSPSTTLTQAAIKQSLSDGKLDSTILHKSEPTSLVASLSSAVVTAAAAAAVAAAQNTLSSGDARSLLSGPAGSSGSSHHHHHGQSHQPRSPGLNSIALKLADSIPEVPYNILHNMKKIDHAAPFYNVPNKAVAGSAKESLPSMLASALSGSGGAADQLTSMFRSPLWKRIADGYGEFTSEFRSLFRAPPTPMKGPSGSTAKLLRDISVPALLMLLASTIPTDWRPVRTRRKSIPLGGDLSVSSPILSGSDPMSAAPSELSSFPLQPMLLRSPPATSGLTGSPALSPQQLFESGQLSRTSDINLQTSETGQQANWINSVHRLAVPTVGGQNHLIPPVETSPSAQMQTIKRLGDSLPNVSANPTNYQQQSLKPVNSDRLQFPATTSNQAFKLGNSAMGGLFSSLTSGLANIAQSKFMNRLMNANGDHDSYRMMSLIPNRADHKIALARRDHLDDKHKYSLVGVADDLADKEKLSPPSKPLLSAMTQAVASMFNSAHESGFLKSAKPTGGIFEVNQIVGDKTINQQTDGLMQRQASAPSGNGAEQRELSQLLPQSWKEAVKRTVSSVQQQASTQWRSIEGQVTNWVQDKLKAFPAASSQQATASSPNANQGLAAASAPVANMIASVSSTAMNILGLGNKNNNAASSPSAAASSSSSGANDPLATSSSNAASSSTSANAATGQKNKSEANKPAKGALAGVADMIVNTLTNRQTSNSQSAGPNSKPSASASGASDSSIASQYSTQSGPQKAAAATAPVAEQS